MSSARTCDERIPLRDKIEEAFEITRRPNKKARMWDKESKGGDRQAEPGTNSGR